MRRIQRVDLSPKTARAIERITAKITAAANPRTDADDRWKRKPKVAFLEIRSSLENMATGRSRCMYCEDSMGTDIDHYRPKADFPHQAFTWTNYLLACSYCNSNQKRTQFPVDANGVPLLIDPTAEDPELHLNLSPTTGEFFATSPKGNTSIAVFGLNDHSSPRRLPKGRKDALISLVALLKEYDFETQNNPAKANEIESTIRDFPFSVVLSYLVKAAASATGAALIGNQLINIINRHNIRNWL